MTCGDKRFKNNRCCDLCPAGHYVQAHCDSGKNTTCGECKRGSYTETRNYLIACQLCKECSPNNHQRRLRECTAKEDTVCECVEGFYCDNADCGHCQPVTSCVAGSGVKVPANRTSDTDCAPCESGTYSNVTDYISPCQAHTRCEDLGRVLKIPGTSTADAICGGFKSHCHWILPASLWVGFVLTALIVFCLIYLKTRCKSHRGVVRASSSVPVTLVEMVTATPICPLELPLRATELNGHCQESCAVEDYKLPLFSSDDIEVSCSTQDSICNSLPITPLKASVSFAGSNHTNGSPGHCTSNYTRTHSEPQEDEWCGT